MISECLNPACRRQLHYLRNGRVVRIVHRVEEQVHVEHFWLCGDCYSIFDLKINAEGKVSLLPRAEVGSPPQPSVVMTLVA